MQPDSHTPAPSPSDTHRSAYAAEVSALALLCLVFAPADGLSASPTATEITRRARTPTRTGALRGAMSIRTEDGGAVALGLSRATGRFHAETDPVARLSFLSGS
jgi:hypothetical protein